MATATDVALFCSQSAASWRLRSRCLGEAADGATAHVHAQDAEVGRPHHAEERDRCVAAAVDGPRRRLPR
eukprot:9135346-Lingulodinium_polyedra.AAC.1